PLRLRTGQSDAGRTGLHQPHRRDGGLPARDCPAGSVACALDPRPGGIHADSAEDIHLGLRHRRRPDASVPGQHAGRARQAGLPGRTGDPAGRGKGRASLEPLHRAGRLGGHGAAGRARRVVGLARMGGLMGRSLARTPTLGIVAMMLALALLVSFTHARVIPERGASRPAASDGATATVRRGDTLYGIAFRNGLDYRDVARWNGIGAPYTIYPGQRLRLTGSASRRTTASTTVRTPARKPPVATPTPSKPATTPVTAGPASNVRWNCSAESQLVNRFAAGDPTRQGVDIAGKRGQPVRAA